MNIQENDQQEFFNITKRKNQKKEERKADIIIEALDLDWLTCQFVSDLHLEMYESPELAMKSVPKIIEPKSDMLALLGDIGIPTQEPYADFLIEMGKKFKLVFVITGNHEFYQAKQETAKTVEEIDQLIEEICSNVPTKNVFFLSNDSVLIKMKKRSVRILGTTLWSDIPKKAKETISGGLNDYNYCYQTKTEKMTVEYTQNMFERNVKWIKRNMKISNKNKEDSMVVFSHHVPSFDGTAEPGYEDQLINHAFASDLEYLLKNNDKCKHTHIKTWLYGHTHWSFDGIIQGTRVATNPRGYPWESVGYNKKLHILL
ncbi:ser/thr protein phosphatase superfamily [Anaeramoeba flamelloides]|uniref:Ser/thr protein phosphatase superfamily n=1 Tax=Anaeramoeba flamelloides TaxID=1746091 RepID=A0ABQ8Y1E8_9EUKA|nr:ser/thr protein phosphatase superfamily [Anaeramoeba flamelloides]